MVHRNIRIGGDEIPEEAEFEARLRKSGNSQVIGVPKTILEALKLSNDNMVHVKITDLDRGDVE